VQIAVALKWVDLRPEVDPLTGAVRDDARFSGCSPADEAALEWALRYADGCSGPSPVDVVAVTAGPAGADAALRLALASGATSAHRIDLSADADSAVVAKALATLLRHCDIVWCGDASLDRGSGAVPALLAAELDAVQALGLVGVELGEASHIVATRRLDGGRRERLRVEAPAVLSVEGSTARLRRASLAATLASQRSSIAVHRFDHAPPHPARVTRPFRPRPRVLPAPTGSSALERIGTLTDTQSAQTSSGDPITLDPAAAADRILEALTAWGYLER
jgi:electron transfer flavoprotein beta subunit